MLALAMLDVVITDPSAAREQANRLVQSYHPSMHNLAAGEHGAVVRWGSPETNLKNVVGLGTGVAACMFVVSDNGNMGVMPYEDLLQEFGQAPSALHASPNA